MAAFFLFLFGSQELKYYLCKNKTNQTNEIFKIEGIVNILPEVVVHLVTTEYNDCTESEKKFTYPYLNGKRNIHKEYLNKISSDTHIKNSVYFELVSREADLVDNKKLMAAHLRNTISNYQKLWNEVSNQKILGYHRIEQQSLPDASEVNMKDIQL